MGIINRYSMIIVGLAALGGIRLPNLTQKLENMVRELGEEHNEDVDEWTLRNIILGGVLGLGAQINATVANAFRSGNAVDILIDAGTAAVITQAVGRFAEYQFENA